MASQQQRLQQQRPQPQRPQPQPQRQRQAQPPQGAPAAGAGGGKGAGATAAPPKAGPKPGQRLPSLNAQQKQMLNQATQRGNLDVFLAQHPGLKQRFANVEAGAGRPKQQENVKKWQAANEAAKAAGQPPPLPFPNGAPPSGASGGKGAAPPAAGPAPEQPPDPSFLNAFNTALGSGASETLGPPAWTGPDPIQTARAAAQRGLDENLANVRARYAGSGFGNSARESLAEGQAVGDFATQFGDVAAQRGMQQQTTGLDRLAQMFSTAGAQDIQGRALGLQADQAMANLGTGLTAIGAQEQEIPNLSNIIATLTNLGRQGNISKGSMRPGK
jgi:hypothetical protein